LKVSFNKISIIGLGYVGLPTAAVIADKGINVIGIDINSDVVERVNRGEVQLLEPGLNTLVKRVIKSGKLQATTKTEKADAFVIAVPTPLNNDKTPNTSHLKAAARTIAPVLERGNLIIIESTSPVGTTELLAKWLEIEREDLTFPKSGSKSYSDIAVAYSPERVLPGQILTELIENDRVVGGLTPSCGNAAVALYKLFTNGECFLTNARTAELIKLAENAYRDINIAYANELSSICGKLNIDVWEMIQLANRHPRVDILNPGPGVGGHCIAVDPWFIADSAPKESLLIKTARRVNDSKPKKVADEVIKAAKNLNTNTIACLGLSYKADVDDLRESPSVKIVELLSKYFNGKILVSEPNIDSLPLNISNNSQVELLDLQSCLNNADIIVLLTDHREFKEINRKKLLKRHIIDTRGIWE